MELIAICLNESIGGQKELLQLARMVGLNAFKELFGTTVFGYVRRLRMQEARLLLEKGQANVSEAA